MLVRAIIILCVVVILGTLYIEWYITGNINWEETIRNAFASAIGGAVVYLLTELSKRK